uniref:Uncharacterized protein n=1 Tax=Arundo donax TaxID=35708 RepID=A0A0A9GDX4_ARUDO
MTLLQHSCTAYNCSSVHVNTLQYYRLIILCYLILSCPCIDFWE